MINMIAKRYTTIKSDDELIQPLYLMRDLKNDKISYSLSYDRNKINSPIMFYFENCEYIITKNDNSHKVNDSKFIINFNGIDIFLDKFTKIITTKTNELYENYEHILSFNKIRWIQTKCNNYSRFNRGIHNIKINELPKVGSCAFLLDFKIYVDVKNKTIESVFIVSYASIGNIVSNEFITELGL